jgi:hypothetical protein
MRIFRTPTRPLGLVAALPPAVGTAACEDAAAPERGPARGQGTGAAQAGDLRVLGTGHTKALSAEPFFRAHLLGGLRQVAGAATFTCESAGVAR